MPVGVNRNKNLILGSLNFNKLSRNYRVYCKYHYLEGHETENPEMEIWKFLVNLSRNTIDITKKQYEESDASELEFNYTSKHVSLLTLKILKYSISNLEDLGFE